MTFAGFPPKVRFTPVPNPLFGPLLEQIDDLSELKCTLRLIWLLHQRRGVPRYVGLDELLTDGVLVRSFGTKADDPRSEIERGITLAVTRGTFATGAVGTGESRRQVYVLNTERDRRALSEVELEPAVGPSRDTEPWEGPADRPNIFILYEDNIGLLSPMVSEELKEAEELYPQRWIEDAFREAVISNKRSWRYVAAILDRWEREGRNDGGTGRYPRTAEYQQHQRR